MSRGLVKLHAYVYYVLRDTLTAFSDEDRATWSALALLTLSMSLLTLILGFAFLLALGHRVSPGHMAAEKAAAGLVGVLVLLGNYLTLLARNRWRRYEREFSTYPEGVKVASGFAVWIGLVAIFGATMWLASAVRHLPP